MKKFLLVGLLSILLSSCSPKIITNLINDSYLDSNELSEVVVVDSTTSVQKSLKLGTITVGDTGFTTDCGYNKIVSDAKTEAAKVGGNILRITELRRPKKWGSTCYKLKADILKNNDDKIINNLKEIAVRKNLSKLPSDADYAIVYFYRPNTFLGIFQGYKVRTDKNEVICDLKKGEKCEMKIYESGKFRFFVRGGKTDTIEIDVIKGEEYYVRCGMNVGLFLDNPDLYLVENNIAREEYKELDYSMKKL